MANNSSELTISRLIPAPPATVWQAWSQPQHLAKWWIPAPIECQVVKLDLLPGGGFQTRMREGDGAFQPHVDACFLEVVTQQRLVWTTQLTEGWQPAEPWLALTAIISFEPSDGGTLYHCRVLHKTLADAQKHEELGFHPGWGATIDQLSSYCTPLR
jgi:uncharacterized protein YndB with AHSA1/START domain